MNEITRLVVTGIPATCLVAANGQDVSVPRLVEPSALEESIEEALTLGMAQAFDFSVSVHATSKAVTRLRARASTLGASSDLAPSGSPVQ